MTEGAGYLLDTNIVSETRKARMDPRVETFLASIDGSDMFISALTLGELCKGVAMKERSSPSSALLLRAWLEQLRHGFGDRILPVDAVVAHRWGELSADRSRPVIDTLLAATALVHKMVLVTRNTGDFDGIDLPLLNPWQA